jgi:hypothetical protein
VCRHQILIKATALGLKESSSRGVKRRRDNDTEHSEANSMSTPTSVTNATPVASTSTIRPSTSESPIPSRAASTPGASPVVQNQTRPPGQSSTPIPQQQQQQTNATHSMPWPMPTVAANTPSPVVVTGGAVEPQRTSYYRAKTTQDDRDAGVKSMQTPRTTTTTTTTHRFVYQTNGTNARSKENGK